MKYTRVLFVVLEALMILYEGTCSSTTSSMNETIATEATSTIATSMNTTMTAAYVNTSATPGSGGGASGLTGSVFLTALSFYILCFMKLQ